MQHYHFGTSKSHHLYKRTFTGVRSNEKHRNLLKIFNKSELAAQHLSLSTLFVYSLQKEGGISLALKVKHPITSDYPYSFWGYGRPWMAVIFNHYANLLLVSFPIALKIGKYNLIKKPRNKVSSF